MKKWFDTILRYEKKQWQIWLQAGRQEAQLFYPKDCQPLGYALPEFEVEMPYKPGDFIQINAGLNGVMVGRALKLLDIRKTSVLQICFAGLETSVSLWQKAGLKWLELR